MDELIERLDKRLAIERAAHETGHNAADLERAELIRLLSEAAAALEAAREDAERYRWLRVNEQDRSDAFLAFCFDELDAAIDQARGKAGQEVEK